MSLSKIINLVKEEALQAYTKGEVPVAAVIFSDDYTIISKAHNLVEKYNSSSAHAEMLVIAEAERKLKTKYLDNLNIFVSLEPCAMCATAISYARIKRLYFAAQDVKFGAILNGVRIYEKQTVLFKPEIYPDINPQLTLDLLQKFFISRR